jgi:hypothetical protein
MELDPIEPGLNFVSADYILLLSSILMANGVPIL